MGGGLPLHQIVLLYGEAGTGKTVLSTQCFLEAARNDCKVFFLDSDQSFSVNRLEQLSGEAELGERIVFFRPESFKEQGRIVERIENLMTRTPTMLVIDSVTGLYRSGRIKAGDYFDRDRELNRQVAYLHALASRFTMWILLTGQVHSSPSGGEWQIEPVAERTLQHWSSTIMRLVKTPRSGVRDCLLEKSNGEETVGTHSPFKITDSGIEDA